MPLDGVSATRLAELHLPATGAKSRDGSLRPPGEPVLHEGGATAIRQEHAEADSRSGCRTRSGRRSRSPDRPAATDESAPSSTPGAGHTFDQGPSRPAHRRPGRPALALRRKALVEERTISDAGSYAFRHQLIRDVAYNSLPRATARGSTRRRRTPDGAASPSPNAGAHRLPPDHAFEQNSPNASVGRRVHGPGRGGSQRGFRPSARRPEGGASTGRRRPSPEGPSPDRLADGRRRGRFAPLARRLRNAAAQRGRRSAERIGDPGPRRLLPARVEIATRMSGSAAIPTPTSFTPGWSAVAPWSRMTTP